MGISTHRRTAHLVLACVWIVAGSNGAAALPQGPVGIDRATALQVFTERTERYVRLRARFEEPLPSFDSRHDPGSSMLTRRYLASAIRTGRANADQGDIFTPAVAAMFRDVIAQAVHDVDIEGLVDEDLVAPDYVVDVVVNEPVPAWALQDLPDALCGWLPALPDAIEYRVVDGTLILWDTHAEIVIDALPGAFAVQ